MQDEIANARTRPAPRGATTAAGGCPASPTCIRTRSSARWRAWPSARPGLSAPARWTVSGPGARPCTAWPRASTRIRCMRSPRSSTSRCSKPATPRSANSTTCTTRPTARRTRDPAAMSQALIDAARETGIRLTLLPVLYMTGGFDGRALSERQRRFGHDVDGYLRLFERCMRNRTTRCASAARCTACARCRPMRCARCSPRCRAERAHPHPHRRTDRRSAGLHRRARRAPGRMAARPTRRSTRAGRWCTPPTSTDGEIAGIARSGATVAICPTTEANLGDGLFPLRAYLDAGGAGASARIRISRCRRSRNCAGSNTASAWHTRHRNIAVRADSPSVGATLLRDVAGQRRKRDRVRRRRRRLRRARRGCAAARGRDRRTTRSTAGSSAATAISWLKSWSQASAWSRRAGTAIAMRWRCVIAGQWRGC